MTLEEIKEATLQSIKQNYEKTGKSSSLKYLYKKVNGLNNRSFFKIFKGVEQAHELAGVPYDKSRGDKMKKARASKNEKRVKQVDNLSTVALMDPSKSLQLSKDVVQYLYNMQGVMGAPSIDDAIKQAYKNAVSTAKLRVTHWPIYAHDDEEFTTEAMVQKLLSYIDYQESEIKDALKFSRETEVELDNLAETVKESLDERYDQGYEKGMIDHEICVPCSSCGEHITILPGTEAHMLIAEFLRENGIIHTDCKPIYQRVYAR